MGILGLNDLLRSECPHIFHKTHIDSLCGKVLAVDISVFLYKYVRSYGEPNWIQSLIRFLCALKKSGIKPVIIFDGTQQPKEKEVEQRRRRQESEKIRKKQSDSIQLRDELEKLLLGGIVETPEEKEEEVKQLIGKRKLEVSSDYSKVVNCMDALSALYERINKQTLSIGKQHYSTSMEILTALGFPYIQAIGEAETLCCYLASIGEVDGIITEDTDVLAYGTPLMISKFDGFTSEVVIVKHDEILRELCLDSREFRDLCIMLSCDYNERCKAPTKKGGLTGIGPKRAYSLIMQHRDIDIISDIMNIDVECLNHKRCRELLSVPNEYPGATVADCQPLDNASLQEISEKYGVRINFYEIEEIYKPVEMVLVEDSDDENYISDDEFFAFENSESLCEELRGLYRKFLKENGCPPSALLFEEWINENYPKTASNINRFTEDGEEISELISYEEIILQVKTEEKSDN